VTYSSVWVDGDQHWSNVCLPHTHIHNHDLCTVSSCHFSRLYCCTHHDRLLAWYCLLSVCPSVCL